MANNIILEKTDSRGEFNLPPATSSPGPEDSEYHSHSSKQLQIRLDRHNAYFPYREESPPVPAATYALSTTPAFRETVRQLSRSTDTMRPTTITKLYLTSMAPTSFPYYRPPDLDNTGAFTGEIRLDLRPLMGIPPKLSVHFLALLPGHRGTMRVRLFPNNGLQDVLITRSEGGDKVEVRFLCAATVVAQQVIEGLSKKWEGSPLMDSMKGGPECVFVGGLGEKGRQSWAGFIEEFNRARAGGSSQLPLPSLPPPPLPQQSKVPLIEVPINGDDEVETILNNAVPPSPEVVKSTTLRLSPSPSTPTNSEWIRHASPPLPDFDLRSNTRSPVWLSYSQLTSDRLLLPPPKRLPRSVLHLHNLHLFTLSHYVTYTGSPRHCTYPLSLTLDSYYCELSIHIPGIEAPIRVDIPIAFESGFTWRFHDTEKNVLVMRVQGELAHLKEGIRKPGVSEGTKGGRFWEEYQWRWTEGRGGTKEVLDCGETVWIHAEGKGGIRAVGEFASELEEVRWGRKRG